MVSAVINPEEARGRFIAWLRWYASSYPAEVPTQRDLGKRLGLTEAGISQLLDPGYKRFPSFETICAAATMLPYPIDYVLQHDPPAAKSPKRR